MDEIRRDHLLSIEEARTNPDKFKDDLIRYIEASTDFGGQVWKKLNREGTILVTDIIIDPTTWVCETKTSADDPHKKTIRLGVQPVPSDVNEKIFPYRTLSDAEAVVYRFTHELAHEVAYRAHDGSEKVKQLYGLARQTRSHGRGLSGLGSLSFYHQDGDLDRPATEDVVELFNMLITGKEHLRGYLDFLGDSGFEQKQNSSNLASFSDPRVRTIMEDALNEGLRVFLADGR